MESGNREIFFLRKALTKNFTCFSIDGPKGYLGDVGFQGAPGIPGLDGLVGLQGEIGEEGVVGEWEGEDGEVAA